MACCIFSITCMFFYLLGVANGRAYVKQFQVYGLHQSLRKWLKKLSTDTWITCPSHLHWLIQCMATMCLSHPQIILQLCFHVSIFNCRARWNSLLGMCADTSKCHRTTPAETRSEAWALRPSYLREPLMPSERPKLSQDRLKRSDLVSFHSFCKWVNDTTR